MAQIIAGIDSSTGLPEGVTLERFVDCSVNGFYAQDVVRDGWALGCILVHQGGLVQASDSTGIRSDHPSKGAAALAVTRRFDEREAELNLTGRSQIVR